MFGCQDCWVEFSGVTSADCMSRTRSKLGGVSILGPKALRCVEGIPLRRDFMLPLGDSTVNVLLGTCSVMNGSDSIEALSKWRLENIYSSGAWSTFWNQRSEISTVSMDKGSSISESDLVNAIEHSISRQATCLDIANAAALTLSA